MPASASCIFSYTWYENKDIISFSQRKRTISLFCLNNMEFIPSDSFSTNVIREDVPPDSFLQIRSV